MYVCIDVFVVCELFLVCVSDFVRAVVHPDMRFLGTNLCEIFLFAWVRTICMCVCTLTCGQYSSVVCKSV